MANERPKRWQLVLHLLGIAILFSAFQARAQEAFPPPQPLTVKMTDENGVDALSGLIHFQIPDAAIGDFAHMKTVVSYDSTIWGQPGAGTPPERDNFVGGLVYFDARIDPITWYPRPNFQVKIGGLSGTFYVNQSGRTLESFDGNTLTGSGVTSWITPGGGVPDYPQVKTANLGIWTFTSRDGTQVEIDTGKKMTIGINNNPYIGVATKITYPDGRIVRVNYRSDCTGSARIQSVTRNDGLMLKYLYDSSSCTAQHTGVIAINTAYEYCDPFADTCSVDPKWRRSQYAYTWNDATSRLSYHVTDQAGATSRFTLDKWYRVHKYKPAGATDDTMLFTYCMSYNTDVQAPVLGQSGQYAADPDEEFCGEFQGNYGNQYFSWSFIYNRIRSVTRSGQTWNYGLPAKLSQYSPYPRQQTNTRPVGPNVIVIMDTSPGGQLWHFIDPRNAIVAYSATEAQRVSSAQVRGQPNTTYTYDARGNVTGNGITSASYDSTCAYIVKCNKPNAVFDAPGMTGNQADFTYDTVHGGVLTRTLPAVGGVRPQTRYTYVQRYAWFLNASGVMTRSTEPIWLLASESYCKTGAASGAGCAISGDEVVTTYDYGPDSGPSNLWLRGKVVTADGVSLRSCYRYSKFGDKISETTPRAGLTVCP